MQYIVWIVMFGALLLCAVLRCCVVMSTVLFMVNVFRVLVNVVGNKCGALRCIVGFWIVLGTPILCWTLVVVPDGACARSKAIQYTCALYWLGSCCIVLYCRVVHCVAHFVVLACFVQRCLFKSNANVSSVVRSLLELDWCIVKDSICLGLVASYAQIVMLCKHVVHV